MLEAHVVSAADRPLYGTSLQTYLAGVARTRRRDSDRGPDRFDHPDAVHVLVFEDGVPVAGSRLTPFDRRTRLLTDFPGLLCRPIPEPHCAAEWSMVFIDGRRGERRGERLADALCCAVMNYCLYEGFRTVGGLIDTFGLVRWVQFRWTVLPLGLPETIGSRSSMAGLFEVSDQALDGASRASGLELVRRDRRRCLITTKPADDPRTCASVVPRSSFPELAMIEQTMTHCPTASAKDREDTIALRRLLDYASSEAERLGLDEVSRLALTAADGCGRERSCH